MKEVDHLNDHVQRFQNEIANVKKNGEKLAKDNDDLQKDTNKTVQENTKLNQNLQDAEVESKHLES